MRRAGRLIPLLLLALAGCAERPKLVMVNARGVAVDCDVPDFRADAPNFLVSQACFAACQARGFHTVPGVQALGTGTGIPTPCTN